MKMKAGMGQAANKYSEPDSAFTYYTIIENWK